MNATDEPESSDSSPAHQRVIDALATSEARYRSILDTAQEGIWVTDPTGRTVFVNPHMAEILGTDVSELEAATLLDFVDPEERPIVSANDGMTARGEVRRYETMLLPRRPIGTMGARELRTVGGPGAQRPRTTSRSST